MSHTSVCYNRLILESHAMISESTVATIETIPTKLSGAEFAAQARDAYRDAHSTLLLGRSTLAQSPLTAPGLVLDPETPTVDERGRALFAALWWAAEMVAPDPPNLSLPAAESVIDSGAIQREGPWLRYNILRFDSLQPLDSTSQEEVIAAIGARSPEEFAAERARAVIEASMWLQRLQELGTGFERVRILALDSYFASLQGNKSALHLLGVASTFASEVSRMRLSALAATEGATQFDAAVEALLARRALIGAEGGSVLWMGAPWREYIAARQPRTLRQGRHQLAAQLSLDGADPVDAAWHQLEGGTAQAAATTLLSLDPVVRSADSQRISELLNRFTQGDISGNDWRGIQLLRAELARDSSNPEEALLIWRELLKQAHTSREQAELYLKMGKLLAERGGARNDDQALAILQMALDRVGGADIASDTALQEMRAEIHKERGWLLAQKRSWQEAEQELKRALSLLSPNERDLRADIYDALSVVQRGKDDLPGAIEHAQAALILRESSGDLMRVGRACNALGILYRVVEEYDNAIQAYQKGLAIFQRLDNQALAATALLNIGTAYHFTERLDQAEEYYRRCLVIADEAGLPVTEVRAHANLCEALMGQGRIEEARLHWRTAWARSQHLGFADEIEYLKQVAERYPALEAELQEDGANQVAQGDASASDDVRATRPADANAIDAWMSRASVAMIEGQELEPQPIPVEAKELRAAFGATLDATEARLLEMLQRVERIDVASVMAVTGASKATATRKLASLVDAGLLVRHGQGRATNYSRAHNVPVVVLAGDLAGLQNRLDRVALRFAQEYNLVRAKVIGVRYGVRSSGESELCYEVRASFTRNPTLDDFFALERALSKATGIEIQLTLRGGRES